MVPMLEIVAITGSFEYANSIVTPGIRAAVDLACLIIEVLIEPRLTNFVWLRPNFVPEDFSEGIEEIIVPEDVDFIPVSLGIDSPGIKTEELILFSPNDLSSDKPIIFIVDCESLMPVARIPPRPAISARCPIMPELGMDASLILAGLLYRVPGLPVNIIISLHLIESIGSNQHP